VQPRFDILKEINMARLKPSNREIEERYQKADRGVSQERSDFLLPQILDFVQHKRWMNLRPEYQRRQVWDRKKQSQFIESLLMNLPVPPVFLFESEYSRYEVMDGQQRLSTIMSFYSNSLKLTGLEYWTELNGRSYSELPPLLQRGLDRRRISAVVLQSNFSEQNDDELRQIVFERLNTGGQRLNAQELRNCIYASPFASMLVSLAGYDVFNDLWEIPRYSDHFIDGHISSDLESNVLFKRMGDCELVLRFFALRHRKNIRGSIKSILDMCMKSNLNSSEGQLANYESDFRSRIDMANDIFGQNAFKIKELDNGKVKASAPFYDAIVIACDRQFENRVALIKKRMTLRRNIHAALSNPEYYELLIGRANTAEGIKQRLDFIENHFIEVL
jgi:hypothetical protein